MSKQIRKITALFLAVALLIGFAPLSGFLSIELPELDLGKILSVRSHAAEIIKSGSCGENVTYTLDSEGTLTISGTGAMKNYSENDRMVFSDQSIRSVEIKNGVTSIGDWAFYCCYGLTSITIPNSVTSIGESAFYCCSGLTSITIPDSVTSIDDQAFYHCYRLTSITIPDSVTSIGNYAFEYCSGLTSIIIPNSVTSIGDWAFKFCSGLTSVTLSDSVTSIGVGAFYYCDNLTNVAIPNSVTSIGDRAFANCSALTSITVNDNNQVYHSAGNCIIETASKTLVAGCNNSVIPSDGSVTSIDECAFEGCSGLTSITIPDSVTSIGNGAFLDCSGLTSITIPDSVTSIGASAFLDCSGLTSITIPDGVTSIGNYAFYECYGLTSVTIPDGVTSIGNYAFYCCSGLTSIIIPDSVTSIDDWAFTYCFGLTSVTIPDSVTSIGDSAFRYCDNLKDVYYSGSEQQWKHISIGHDNENLINADIHFNPSGPEPDIFTVTSVDYTWDQTLSIDKHETLTLNLNKPFDNSTFDRSKFRITVYDSYGTVLREYSEEPTVKFSLVLDGDGQQIILDTKQKLPPGKLTVSVSEGFLQSTEGKSLAAAEILCSNDMYSQTRICSTDEYTKLQKKYFKGYGTPLTKLVVPGLDPSQDMCPQAIAYYQPNNWVLIGSYSRIGNASAIFALDYDTGEHIATFYLQNPDGSPNKSHLGGIAVSGNNLYISDGIVGEKSTVGYVPLSEIKDKKGPEALRIKDHVDIGYTMNAAYPAYMSFADGILWTGNFYDADYSLLPGNTFYGIYGGKSPTVLIGFETEGSSSASEWNDFKSKAEDPSRYTHYTIQFPDEIRDIQGCYVADGRCYLSRGATTLIENTIFAFDIDLSSGKSINASADYKTIKNLCGAENLFMKDGYLHCIYESVTYGKKERSDVLWKIDVNELFAPDVIPASEPNAVVYREKDPASVKSERFAHSLEDVLAEKANSTVYNPELAHLLMAFSKSAYDPECVKASLINFGFAEADIYQASAYRYTAVTDVAYSIATKQLSDGTTLVMIPIRGTEDALEWLTDATFGLPIVNLGNARFHQGFKLAAEDLLYNLEKYFNGKLPTKNVKYVITGHSRGAAVGNLLSYYLLEKGISGNNIYDYNFAVPDVFCSNEGFGSGTADFLSGYEFIFNISNADDMVSYLPGNLGNTVKLSSEWGKFGHNLWFVENAAADPNVGFSAHSSTRYLKYTRKEYSSAVYKSRYDMKVRGNTDGSFFENIKNWIVIGGYCPIDIRVYDKNNVLLAEVTDGKVTVNDTNSLSILVMVKDDEKAFAIPNTDDIRVEIIGTDAGTMKYYVAKTDLFGDETAAEKQYVDVALDEGKRFVSEISREGNNVTLSVLDESENIRQDVLVNGVEYDITAIPEGVTGIGFTPAAAYTLIENVDGELTEDGSLFVYDVPEFNTGDEITVHFSDGNDKKYTYRSYEFDNGLKQTAFFTEDGEYLHADMISGQGTDIWSAGEYSNTVSAYGFTAEAPVTVTENPIKEISAEYNGFFVEEVDGSAAYSSVTEENDGITVNEIREITVYEVDSSKIVLTLQYADGEEFTGTVDECAENFKTKTGKTPTFSVQKQEYDNRWSVGMNYPLVTFSGISAEMEVEVRTVGEITESVTENSDFSIAPAAGSSTACYSFVPQYNCNYRFSSAGDCDPDIRVYRNGVLLGEDDDSGENENFDLTVTLDAGAEYTFAIALRSGTPQNCSVHIDHLHDPDIPAATCTSPQVCTICGAILENTVGHKWDSGRITNEPTYDTEGEKIFTCSVCEATRTETVPKLEKTYTPGDVNADGQITTADARLALREAVGLENYAEDSEEFLACDVDLDGEVTPADARLILRAAVGLEDPETWIKA